MIVPPNFLEDWRMEELAMALNRDPMAPLYVIRLWSWCQSQKRWQFPDYDINKMRAICKALHEPEVFMQAMEQAGYAERHEGGFSSPMWAELNAQLIAAWTNGKSGGRPVKKPNGIPTDTQGGNPTVNPGGNPTDAVGLTDKKRQDKKKPRSAPEGASPPPSAAPSPPPAEKPVEAEKPLAAPTPQAPPPEPPAAPPSPAAAPLHKGVNLFGDEDRGMKPKPKAAVQPADSFPRPDSVTPGVWAEFLAYRMEMATKNKKAPFTHAAMKGVVNVYLKRCISIGESGDDALLRCMAQGWAAPYQDLEMARAHRFDQRGAVGGPMRRPTANDQHAAAGAALAGFGRPQPERKPHAANSGDVEDIDYREFPDTGPPEQ